MFTFYATSKNVCLKNVLNFIEIQNNFSGISTYIPNFWVGCQSSVTSQKHCKCRLKSCDLFIISLMWSLTYTYMVGHRSMYILCQVPTMPPFICKSIYRSAFIMQIDLVACGSWRHLPVGARVALFTWIGVMKHANLSHLHTPSVGMHLMTHYPVTERQAMQILEYYIMYKASAR